MSKIGSGLLLIVSILSLILLVSSTINNQNQSWTERRLQQRAVGAAYKINSANNARLGGNPHATPETFTVKSNVKHIVNQRSESDSTMGIRSPIANNKQRPVETRSHVRSQADHHHHRSAADPSLHELERVYTIKFDNFNETIAKKGKIYYSIFGTSSW